MNRLYNSHVTSHLSISLLGLRDLLGQGETRLGIDHHQRIIPCMPCIFMSLQARIDLRNRRRRLLNLRLRLWPGRKRWQIHRRERMRWLPLLRVRRASMRMRGVWDGPH